MLKNKDFIVNSDPDNLFLWVVEAEGVFFYPQLLLAAFSIIHLIATFLLLRHKVFFPKNLKLIVSGVKQKEDFEKIEFNYEPLGATVTDAVNAVKAGETYDFTESQVRLNLQDLNSNIERRLSYLNLSSQTNMLVGLLGTVWGLVNSFITISQANVAPPPKELAAGVSQALMTTIVGLLVAIPMMAGAVHMKGTYITIRNEVSSVFLILLEKIKKFSKNEG